MKAKIGLEIHVQLNTQSKLFCSCPTDYRDKDPNTIVCPVCLGFPGSRPRVNKKALDFAISIAEALNCRILPKIFFSRKSYLYPDMSKNFQITQYEVPLARDGFLMINIDGQEKKVRIRRLHLEEDPAKLIHVGGDIMTAEYVLIDYNRSGIPLCEIVTEPDFETPKQVRVFLTKLSAILEYLGVYDSSLEGSMRVDVNVSIKGNERVEIKNMSGFRMIEKALNYEIIRQNNILRQGGRIKRETRGFDESQGITRSLRAKEFEEDYGYIYEPDLTVIEINDEWKKQIQEAMPELPEQRVERFQEEYRLSQYQARVIVYSGKALSNFFEECCRSFKKPRIIARWMITDLLKCLNYQRITIDKSKITVKNFVDFLRLIDQKKITERLGKEIIKEITMTGEHPENYLKRKGLKLVDNKELEKIVKKVLEKNEKAVSDYKSGEEKALEFLIGQVLKETRMTGDPKIIRKIIKARVAQTGQPEE